MTAAHTRAGKRGPEPIAPAIRLKQRLQVSGDCIVFTGALRGGYGVLVTGSRSDGTRRIVRAHRLAWELANGTIPDGQFVCHHCDNRACCKVEHLFLGSARDNTQDMMRKGRHGYVSHPGVRNGRALLTEDDVRSIRLRAEAGESHARLAAEFGVGASTVFGLIHRLSWRCVQ